MQNESWYKKSFFEKDPIHYGASAIDTSYIRRVETTPLDTNYNRLAELVFNLSEPEEDWTDQIKHPEGR